MAGGVTAADPGRHLLDKIDAREQALTREAAQAQAQIDEATARLRELSEAISDLQVTRKTLISLAGHDDDQRATEPAVPSPALPDHPAYQQILDAFADLRRPLRARDLCVALDLPIAAKNTENIRSKLERLASRKILIETEPDCSSSHAQSPAHRPPARTPNPTPPTKRTSTREPSSECTWGRPLAQV
jgi:chromosome segregation ATPase